MTMEAAPESVGDDGGEGGGAIVVVVLVDVIVVSCAEVVLVTVVTNKNVAKPAFNNNVAGLEGDDATKEVVVRNIVCLFVCFFVREEKKEKV